MPTRFLVRFALVAAFAVVCLPAWGQNNNNNGGGNNAGGNNNVNNIGIGGAQALRMACCG